MKIQLLFFLLIIGLAGCNESKTSGNIIDKKLHIIPEPSSTKVYEGEYDWPSSIVIYAGDSAAQEVSAFMGEYFSQNGEEVYVEKKQRKGRTISLSGNAMIDSLGEEGYVLKIDQQGVSIVANSGAGLFYGFQTLLQILTLDVGDEKKIPFVEISDKPAFVWRGLHLDVCRHYFPVSFIKKYIDRMAAYKLNHFHWHLTEDQGWRIEIKKYPLLTEMGGYRKETIVEKNFNPYIGDGKPHGGFYTQDEIREVVAYAAERFVTVVPEIEMPGHSLAALSAYPEYSCTGGPFEVGTKWGVYEDIYCTTDSTFAFLTNILDEVMALFPSKYIHIGGDEAPKTRWKECTKCQSRIAAEGLKDEHELQSFFIRRIEKHLQAHGRKLIGWDEILEGGLSPGATVMSWRGEEGGIEAARQGHDVIMTPNFVMYFDHYQGPKESEPLAIGGFSPIEKVYAYNPVPEELLSEERKHILGVQANLWTEYMETTDHVEYMAYPRVLALSEIAWTAVMNKSETNFFKKVEAHLPSLKAAGWQFRPLNEN